MKRMLLFAMTVLGLAGYAAAQNYVDVAPGDGTLSAAIAAANDGDILRLLPEAEYTESVNKTIGTIAEKTLGIYVEGDGSVKARVKILTDPGEGTCQFFNVGNNGRLILFGLEFDGAVDGVTKVSYLARCYMGETPMPAFIKKFHVESCTIMNLKSNVLDGAGNTLAGNVVVDTTIVNNCIIHNTGTVVHYKYVGCNYIKVSNSTMYNINSYGMRINGNSDTQRYEYPEVHVDHTTWYNMGLTDLREIILTEKATALFDKPIYITNSIFSTQTNWETSTKTALNIKTTLNDNMAVITNICMWQLSAKKNWLKHTVRDTVRMDPGFADPANGDFTLPAGSILLTYGTDKGPIGDRRWAANYSAVAQDGAAQPEAYTLAQNYPNPFNPATTIAFSLSKPQTITLMVYDARGRRVAVLAQGRYDAGEHQVAFSGADVPSGLYFYELIGENFSRTKKMLLVK